MTPAAVFSPDRQYRYLLRRRALLGAETTCLFVLLNPSTADETVNDPTIRRCLGFARSWGFGHLVVANLFALRSTDPKPLYQHPDPVGPDNDRHIAEASAEARLTIAGWGNHGELRHQGEYVRLLLDKPKHLGLTKQGHPRHPLYLRADTAPLDWQPPQGRRPG